MSANRPFEDGYVVLTDELGHELTERYPANIYFGIDQPATPYDAGTMHVQVGRTVKISYKATRDLSVAITVGTKRYGHLIEARRVTVRRNETADFSLIQTVRGEVVNSRERRR